MTTTRLRALLLSTVLAFTTLALPYSSVRAAPAEGFAASQIRAIWQRDDGPVAAHTAARSWTWGPGPFYTDYEPYRETPDGNHLVQYFDKGRLEINDPNADPSSPWFVTSGLLVKEMVTGKAQTGDNTLFTIGPAAIPVAGDGEADRGPTYAQFALLTGRVANKSGRDLPNNSYLNSDGKVADLPPASGITPVALPRFEEASGHNWAAPFWSFANSTNRPPGFDWTYSLGYPITEPYWISVPVKGQQTYVLVQLFERRTLTYNPENPADSQVEMGNVGRHYYAWRYGASKAADLAAQYDASITVGTAPSRTTQVTEKLTFTNNTDSTLDNAILRVPWNHWKGVVTLQSIAANGRTAQAAWKQAINLDVTLPQPVAPGATVTLELTLELKPRPVGGRTGYDKANDILSLGDMLPTLVPWQNGGWQYYPYSELGDLGNNTTANYHVEIASAGSEKLVVGGTGKITDRAANGTRWQFTAANVRDVAYVVSPRFINPLEDSSMTRQEGNVKILAYFLPGHKADGQRQLQLVGPALSWFSKRIGAYPFDTYMIAEMGVPLERTDNYAQEYPMAYFVPTSWLALDTDPGTWPWYIPVHEVGHQWFYSTVGNNQLIDPWLDEALTTYITAEYVRANYPNQYGTSWSGMTISATGSKPVSAGVYSGFANENQYSAAIYDSGAVLLDKVRRAMGDNAFYAALQEYYTVYKFQRARPANLTMLLQKHTTTNLQPIFTAYLGY
ncbi:MAG: M1 family aminopeptidase [Chloroflexota bacterium]